MALCGSRGAGPWSITHIALWGRWQQPQAGIWPGRGRCFPTAPQPRGSENVPQDHPRPRGGGWPGSLASACGVILQDNTEANQILRLAIWRCPFFVSTLRDCVYVKRRCLSMVCKKQSSRYIEQYTEFPYSFTHRKLYICNTVWCICLQNI